MLSYATEQDLTTWMGSGPAPDNATALLRSASLLIRSTTKGAVYRTDTDGYATDPGTRDAFRDATCAQAKYWADLGVEPSTGAAGVKPVAASKSIGGASITYATAQAAVEAQAAAAGELAPDAYRVLEQAGLLGGDVVIL